ncbi:MAG: ferredoxin--NADP reductase [Melioribacteraceae bacterium]|nr:ferredoxin--NADP reductase [Melioribacteraceae bacterium]
MQSPIYLRITDINKNYKDTLCLTLRADDNKITDFLPGQFLTLLIDVEGEEVRRGFSIASSPDELPDIMLAIKKVDDGVISNYLYDKVEVGDRLKALSPLGNFTVRTNPDNTRHLVMFGAGSGITPLFSQLKSVLFNEPGSKITLFYGNRNEDSIIYKSELDELKSKFAESFEIYYYLSKPDNEWEGPTGRISKEMAVNYLNTHPDAVGAKVDYYLCGPEEMMKEIIEVIKDKGLSSSKIHREIYHTSVIEDDEEIEEIPREVTVIFKGNEHKIIVNPDESILQKALATGLELPNSCQFGSCSSCKAKLISGQMKLIDQTALSEEELEQGYCLTCVGHPATDNVVILYDNDL